MALRIWSRKSEDNSIEKGPIGLDLNSSRARAALGRGQKNKLLPLGEQHNDFPISINLDKRPAEVGPSAWAISRKLPHLICSNYLPFLGQPNEWKGNRITLNAESALALTLDKIRQLCAMADSLALALPPYLTLPQVGRLLGLAEKCKLKIGGTASLPMALAAERATHYLQGQQPDGSNETPRGNKSFVTTNVLIVDSDEHALTASLIRISEEEVRQLGSIASTRTSGRLWRERLLDALSDRCVRICRRDPRDNADVEQMLFDQLDDAIDRARDGQRVSLQVRSTHWYQDLAHIPAEFEAFCSPLTRLAIEDIRHLIHTTNLAEPPRAVWLTHDAGRLPGLATALHAHMSEGTSVRVLHPEAAAAAAANLMERWGSGELPKTHLDTLISLPPKADPRLQSRPAKTSRK